MSSSPFGYRPPPTGLFVALVIVLAIATVVVLLTSCQKTKPPLAKQTATGDTYNVIATWDASQDQRVAGYKMHLRNNGLEQRLIDAGSSTTGVAPNILLGTPYSLSLSAYSSAGETSTETNPIVFVLSGDGQLPVPMRNVSTRAFVQTGDRVVIGGFIVAARGRFLVRGLGPSLVPYGVRDPLLDPFIQVFNKQQAPIAFNDDWTSNEADLRATVPTLLPSNPKESALLIALEPGEYTAILSGANKTSGTGLVEVYYIP